MVIKEIKNSKKNYWYFLFLGTLLISIIRIVSLICSVVIQYKLTIHAQLSENSITVLQNSNLFFLSEARWICYFVMFMWAFFWIKDQLHFIIFLIGTILLWVVQLLVIFIALMICSSYINSYFLLNSILHDCFLNCWPRIIIIGSIIFKFYYKRLSQS